ncbi:disease resistance protein RPS2-like [Magnolia sinica]|uniref:disease resistance protein RPS2-like n=1 Tax=Magnolia sinica TaxID=86752 RepID=UPI00265B70E2|nr:disease resistance protein RPS2-like [Magnolia sinica]XP_058074770.1 disease resistance protein RPS2-like [Magnolia sinica]
MDSIISRLLDPITQRTGYVVNLQKNMDSLKNGMNELKCARNDVKKRVEVAERKKLKRTDHVHWWLEKVESIEREVNAVVEESKKVTRTSWSGYQLCKKVAMKLDDVVELKSKVDSFDVVAEKPPPDAIEEMPCTSAVGMNLMLSNALGLISEDEVGIFGIYGMGGVGKTTLLKKINNEFLVRTHEFAFIIWVVVSRESNVEMIQKDIGQRLGLSWVENDSKNETRARDIYKVLSNKKFMLLFDDIWERLDLETIGIPHPSSQNMSKVVFTTRFEDVCGRMAADKKIRVQYLPEKEAMDLFLRNVGEEAMISHRDIPSLAMKVAKECKGLPLALITIGRAMACKKTPQEWEHAISVLSTSKPPSEISGMDDEMLLRLKFSYDNLGGDMIKSCFLYCALFPEDYSIRKEQLIDYWIGEGFLDGWDDDLDEARNKGHDIIGRLKAVCLLENGSDEKTEVKFHDVIRDLALWIASECGKKKNRFLVRAGIGLRHAPDVERWKEADRISLMNNYIKEITEKPQCPNLFTLMLQMNSHFENVHTDFFQFMPVLKVLDLSHSSIKELPVGMGNLAELRYLNLSCTCIESLPKEIGNLTKLKHLDLESTDCLQIIPRGAISRLSELIVMNLNQSYSKWEEGSGGCNMTELVGLKRLTHLQICIETLEALERLLSSNQLRNATRFLQLKGCEGLTTSTQLLYSFSAMKSLKGLSIQSCDMLKEVTIGADGEREDDYLVYCLESLELDRLPVLNYIHVGRGCFRSFRSIYIWNCFELKKIHYLLQLENLETIEIIDCPVLEEVINTADDDEVREKGLMQLKAIKLWYLPELSSICSHALHFPSLEVLNVMHCPKLKKLPLHVDQNSLRLIRGEKDWWDALVWESDYIKSYFLPFFKEW